MLTDAFFQQLDELEVHVLILIGDVETDDAFVFQPWLELGSEFRSMGRFHNKDDVCPFEEFGGNGAVRITADSGRSGFNIGPGGK